MWYVTLDAKAKEVQERAKVVGLGWDAQFGVCKSLLAR
jgi:hypothetical protein